MLRGKWIATIGLAIVLGCLFPVGIYAHLILTDVTDTDLIVPSLVNDASVFPFWATDFLVVSILAAAMSSMDSVLLVFTKTSWRLLDRHPASSYGPAPRSSDSRSSRHC